MNTLVSDIRQPDMLPAEPVPLSGAKLDAAIKAMEAAGFIERLTVRIMKLAAGKGFYNPFDEVEVDLPGGKSAAGLATEIVEKALIGRFIWDDEKHPDFYRFCCSRGESILSNWLAKNRRLTSMSPVFEGDDVEEVDANAVNSAIAGTDVYEILRFRNGGKLGDQLLEEFALTLADNSDEQSIVMAVHDDRECISRAYCRGKLNLSEKNFDAAMKRIRRAASDFLKEWCNRNNI